MPPVTPSPLPAATRRLDWLAAGVIAAAALLAYHNSFSGPFVFDTVPAVTDNPTIRHLWPPGPVLSPPHAHGQTVGGRPLLNLSLALNYALSRDAAWSYHALNLLIHVLAGLVLFGLVRRTLGQPVLRARFGAAAQPLALAVAVLWTLHPLQTESVTYIVQRAESLMGLCCLLTLYAFVRGTESPAPRRWFLASFTACLLGMAAKEVMVTAPLLVLLYDRTFVAGSFRAAWGRRSRYYLSLAATWLLLAWLVAGSHNRGGSAGFGSEISWWPYALTQFRAIVLYLQLCVWPAPLVLDYGTGLARGAGAIVPCAVLVLGLAAGTGWALRRRPVLGFLGAWFFAILAPSSSVVPVATQTMAEHRMYLPLAAVLALVVMGIYLWAGRRTGYVVIALALVLGWLTERRNEDYRSEFAIWNDTVQKRPDNARAQHNLGFALFHLGRVEEAVAHYQQALLLKPDDAETHHNLGNALLRLGRVPEAEAEYALALRLRPEFAEAHYNLGNALFQSGRLADAIAHYEQALRIEPADAAAHANLGNALLRASRTADALAHYARALELEPDNAATHASLAGALLQAGRVPEARAEAEKALALQPGLAEAHYNLANALLQQGRWAEAAAHYAEALRVTPDQAQAHASLGFALLQLGRTPEAIAHYGRALQLAPDDAEAHNNLGYALAQAGRDIEAIREFEAALRLRPDYAQARENLLRLQGQPPRAKPAN